LVASVLDYAPFAATAFAIPEFLPQLLKLRRTNDTHGISWTWAALTSVNNAAWMAYFTLSRYWTALVPSTSATVLAGTLAAMLLWRRQANRRRAVLISAWAVLLLCVYLMAGREGLGFALTGSFILQATPSVWTAYRTRHPTGISTGTWMLVFGELSCWTAYGIRKSDPRLIVLGITGITASVLMLYRAHRSGPALKAEVCDLPTTTM
jgi:uncharacterized protein with PQ loop repeat